MPNQTEIKIPWGNDAITIKGRNSGAETLTVHFDGETLNIVDFLNHSLNAEYAALYEEIMSRYEAKLNCGSIFDHNFPEAAFAVKRIDLSSLKHPLPANDKELIELLLAEYNICLNDLKAYFKKYETHVEQWYNNLSLLKIKNTIVHI
jgi:hypothetical protein